MRQIQIDYPGTARDFQGASQLAKNAARENLMQDPTIIAWHRNNDATATPFYDGADLETWYAKYGAGNGGKLEVRVGDDFQFVMMDARAFEQLGPMPLRNLTDAQGNEYLCYTPMLGMRADKPTAEAGSQPA